jgi:ribonuclease HI
MQDIIIHTDGGCSGNPGPGAWAYVMRYAERLREDCGYGSDTTNNKMELKAVIEALAFLSTRKRQVNILLEEQTDRTSPTWLLSPIRVFTDSQYVKNGVQTWLRGWKAKGWKTADKKPVKNQELWMELDLLVQELKPSFFWVEGHAGNPDNERCDFLVRETIKTMRTTKV